MLKDVVKQWYKRRKPDANCYVGDKFMDPVEHKENCQCTDADYECDYNFIRQNNDCVPAGPERIPANVCSDPDQMYLGSSGYRKIPGNTCEGGVQKDTPNLHPTAHVRSFNWLARHHR
ncbi:hypothetical protein F5887DRAFT_886480 [Amanita rubescens]|nr:hypothetical protein F5887DRAFT_886480 [Amanita rubescens]